MAWNSAALKSGSLRERFSPPLVVVGIAAAFLGVLALLYPEQELLRILYHDSHRVPTTRVYLQSVVRARPGDHQSRLQLATLLVESGDYREALRLLDARVGVETTAEQARYRRLEYAALAGLVRSGHNQLVYERFVKVATDLLRNVESVDQARMIHADAQKAGAARLEDQARLVLARLAPGDTDGGDYRQRAAAAFSAMAQAAGEAERRALFLKGIRILQEGNLYHEVIEAADRHIGSLRTDRETLVALTKISLAVGRPDRAQKYIRQALGMGPAPGDRP